MKVTFTSDNFTRFRYLAMTFEIQIQNQTTIINDTDTKILEEVNDNDDVKMPEEFLHSGYVAVATVISFLVVVCVIIGVYYIHVKCALKKNEKREKNVIESRSSALSRET